MRLFLLYSYDMHKSGIFTLGFSQVPEDAGLRLVQTPSAKSHQKSFPRSVPEKAKVLESSWEV